MRVQDLLLWARARPHIVSRFGTENGEPVDVVED